MPLNRDRATFLLPVQKRKMICLLYHILGRRVPAPAVTRPRSVHTPPPPHTAGKSGGPCRGHHAAHGRPGAPAVLVCRAVSRRCLHATWEPFQTDMPLNNRDRATFLLPMQKRKMICLLYHILGRRVPAPAVTRPRSVHPPPPPIRQARAVVLVGGTMQPTGDLVRQLFSSVEPSRVDVFSCGHVIPKENLLPLCVSR